MLSVFSLEDVICADSRQHTLTWQDILSDEADKDHEDELCQLLYRAIQTLEEDEQRILKKLFFEKRKSEVEVAQAFGISQQLINYRKKKILKKLHDFFVKAEFLSE